MKTFTTAVALALAAVASAQLDNIPSCALPCLLAPLQNDGCASLADFKCHCEKAESLFAAVVPCVEGACSAEDNAAAISAVQQTCGAAGVPVEVPGSGASSAPAASGVAPTSAAPPASSAVESAASSAASELSSALSLIASSVESVVSSALATPTPSGDDQTDAPSATSATPTQFTGAAAQITNAAGLMGAAAIALLAL